MQLGEAYPPLDITGCVHTCLCDCAYVYWPIDLHHVDYADMYVYIYNVYGVFEDYACMEHVNQYVRNN